MNDFYESALNDFTKGAVEYPLSGLEEGRHQITVRAYDVANNSNEAYTEFIVSNSAEIALQHVLNYPNPFVDNTCFLFEHNLPGQEIDVQIQIFTASGRLVKTLQEQFVPSEAQISLDECIKWDGTDDFGDQLARGVYLYRVRARGVGSASALRSGESAFEKLVILK